MDCVFCKIVKGELPCYKIYENDDVLAFSVRLDYNLSSGEFEQECEMKIVAEYV